MRALVGRGRLVGTVGVSDFIAFVQTFFFSSGQFVVGITVVGIFGGNSGTHGCGNNAKRENQTEKLDTLHHN